MGPTGLTASAWATLIITSIIFYGGFIYYVFKALNIDPKTLPKKALEMAHPEYVKKMWRKDHKTKMFMAGGVAFLLLVAAMLAGFGAYRELEGAVVEDVVEEELDEYVLVRELVMEQTGTANPASVGSGATSTPVPFTIREGCKRIIVNLSSTNARLLTDYDLYIYGPDGNQIGSSATFGSDQSAEIEARGNNTLANGTYEAEIIFFAGTMGTSWHIEVTAWYMQPLEGVGEEDVL